VSVIVPVYNELLHLEDLLRSVLDSPVKKEVIIVDDGSTDGTREKLLALPHNDDVTIVFHERNYGRAERALSSASGLRFWEKGGPHAATGTERLRRTS